MKRFPIPSWRVVLLLAALVPGTTRAASAADTTFEQLARTCIEDYLTTSPEAATALGDHRFDDRLTDYSPEARERQVASLQQHLAALAQIDAAGLNAANRIDAQILRVNLEAQLFDLTEEQSFAWNPLSYNGSLGDALFALVAREFAPPEQRLRAAARRLEAIPRVLEQMRANLKHPPRIHTETAIRQTAGAIELVRTGLDPLLERAPALRAELAPAQAKAIAALEQHRKWLEQDVLPKADGDFRLGEARFRRKLRLALDSELSLEELLARAERELATTTEAMYATARPLYERAFPQATAAELADRPRVIKAVLDRLAERRANDDTVVARVKEITADATTFVRQRGLVTVPDAPLQVIVLPEFQRGVAIAYCDPPGALEPNGETFYKVSPTPADWTPQRKDSFFREYNDYMLHDLTVHEAMPGHYLQLAHSNRFRAPTLVRAIWWSGTFVEGWAVYAERIMADAGYGGPEVKLQQLKMRLRAIINAILDQKIHVAGMTEREALALMMERGFQEEGEAVGKWRRACQSSTQLSTYFVGAVEHDDMRAAAEKKAGAAFDLRKYHDTALSIGSPPVKYVRQTFGW
ncbi:DUF885 domain-containing protein [Opitutus sp. ER46]|uniref:DUF885 domain-containing protein n=1 Tax=Opitutus sp. ER46 TaxID=2161864 RepID=UPI0013047E36|nr:DUF885 domain-containing protein [Opitutus sp. ER46]